MILPSGYVVYDFNQVDSTSEVMKREFLHLGMSNIVICAKSQSNGRGRKDRTWISSNDGLYASVLLSNDGFDPRVAILIAVVIGNVIYEKARSDIELKYKWPNDILLPEGKVCGILSEYSHENKMIVGFGVNIDLIDNMRVGYLSKYMKITALDLLEGILRELNRMLSIMKDRGFDLIRNMWLMKAYKLDSDIIVDSQKGIFKGIDMYGNMILQQGDIQKIISYGDVS